MLSLRKLNFLFVTFFPLSVNVLSFVMLGVTIVTSILLFVTFFVVGVIILSVVMLIVAILRVIMLSVIKFIFLFSLLWVGLC